MERNNIIRSRAFLVVVFLSTLILHFVVAVHWFERNFFHYFNNYHLYIYAVSRAYHEIVNSRADVLDLSVFRAWLSPIGAYWPPLGTMIMLWALMLLSLKWLFLLNFFYLIVIMLGIYFSTRRLIDNDFYSMLAAVIFSFYMGVDVQLVSFEVQLAVTACIIWGFYCYLRSDSFTRFWPSLFVGLFMVLALYCDRLSPCIFLLALFLVPDNFKKKKSIILMCAVFVLVVAVTGPFYIKWMGDFWGTHESLTRFFDQGDRMPPETAYRVVLSNPVFLFYHLSYYLICLTEFHLGYGFTALLLIGGIFFRRLEGARKRIIWTAIVLPLIVFLLIIKKDFAYIFPLCLYFSIITAVGIYYIRPLFVRCALIAVIVGLVVIQYAQFFYVSPRPQSLGPCAFSRALFSSYFFKMGKAKVPRLWLIIPYLYPNNTRPMVNVLVDQLRLRLPIAAADKEQILIADLRNCPLLHGLVLSLAHEFPDTKVINTFMEPVPEKCSSDDLLFLLSDKEMYRGPQAVKTSTGYSWEGVEARHFLGFDTVLYKLKGCHSAAP